MNISALPVSAVFGTEWTLVTDNAITHENFIQAASPGEKIDYQPGTLLCKPGTQQGNAIPVKSEKMLLRGTFTAEQDGYAICTAGADYWFAVAVNGKEVYNSYPHGNSGGPSAESMVFLIPVKQGENSIAMFVESGSFGCSLGLQIHQPTRENLLRLNIPQTDDPAGILYEPWTSEPEAKEITARCVTFGPAVVLLEYRKQNTNEEWKTVIEKESGYFTANRSDHSIRLKDLEPDTAYEYRFRVFSDAKEYQPSQLKHFRTLPENPDTPIRILILTDTHAAGPSKYRLMEHFLTKEKCEGISFLAHLGDFSGSYNNFSYEILYSLLRFFSEREISLLAIQGNHERIGAEASQFNNYLRYKSGRLWTMFKTGDSVILGLSLYDQPTEFVFGEQAKVNDNESVFQQNLEELKQALNSDLWKNAKFRIVMNHEPYYKGPGPHSAYEQDMWDLFHNLFNTTKLPSIWFGGHIHDHKYIATTNIPREGENKALQEIEPQPFPILVLSGGEKTEEFTMADLTIEKERLILKTTDWQGKEIETVIIASE